MKSTKSRSKNLLHFVHSELIRLDPEAATLRQELEHTELAGRLDVKVATWCNEKLPMPPMYCPHVI